MVSDADRPDLPATCAETHISWVLLTGDRALKILKPLATDVLDHADVERRRLACEQEVELNARLAPDVYRGVASIRLGGEDLEPVIVMARMPDERRLSRLLDADEAPDVIRDIARTVASFHGRAQVLDTADAARVSSPTALERRWTDDLDGLRAVGGAGVRERADAIEALVIPYLDGRAPLLRERIEAGMVRDGHGDLLADDIFCLDDGPRILDCLAFSDELRWGDVLADVGFLVMDLQRRGHPELGRAFLHAYCEFSAEHHPGSLAHLYVAQRALVRAKVTALRNEQEGGHEREVDDLLALVDDHLRRTQMRMVLVGGLPGSGKSTFAHRMADEFGWTVLSSDEIRRDLGLRRADLRDDAYSSDPVAAVYGEMRRRASQLLSHGISVVLDATWTSADERRLARGTAADARADVLEVRCHAPAEVCRRRVEARSDASLSEATAAVVDVLAERQDPWPEAFVLDTSRSTSDQVWEAFASEARPTWWRAVTAR